MKITLAKMSSVPCFRELKFRPILGIFLHFVWSEKVRCFSVEINKNSYNFIKKLKNLIINKKLIKKMAEINKNVSSCICWVLIG